MFFRRWLLYNLFAPCGFIVAMKLCFQISTVYTNRKDGQLYKNYEYSLNHRLTAVTSFNILDTSLLVGPSCFGCGIYAPLHSFTKYNKTHRCA